MTGAPDLDAVLDEMHDIAGPEPEPEAIEEYPPLNRRNALIAAVLVAAAAAVSALLPMGWAT